MTAGSEANKDVKDDSSKMKALKDCPGYDIISVEAGSPEKLKEIQNMYSSPEYTDPPPKYHDVCTTEATTDDYPIKTV